jgi:hypothetical protein
MHPFDGPRIKLDRAKRHLDALDKRLELWNHLDPYHIFLEPDQQQPRYIVKLQVGATVPAEWGALIGDFAFNLRSALDQIAWAFAKRLIDDPGNTQFPIFRTNPCSDKNLLGKWRSQTRYLGVAYDFIEGLQPYHRGDEAEAQFLWVLHEKLCNTDKHRTITSLGHQYRIKVGDLPDGKAVWLNGLRLNDFDVIGYVPLDIDPEKQLQPNLLARVVFDIGEPYVGIVMHDLRNMYDVIERRIFPALAGLYSETEGA